MSRWIKARKRLPPRDMVVEVYGWHVSKFATSAGGADYWLRQPYNAQSRPIISSDMWRPVKPPKERKPQPETWYSAAACLPREGAVVEVRGKGRCRFGNGSWFHLPYWTPWWLINSTDEWRPVEGEDGT